MNPLIVRVQHVPTLFLATPLGRLVVDDDVGGISGQTKNRKWSSGGDSFYQSRLGRDVTCGRIIVGKPDSPK